MIESINWLGYGSFRLEGPPLIYINPFRVVRGSFHPDAILIGHHFHEQFSLADVQKLRGPATRILCNARVAQDLDDGEGEITVLRSWQTATIDRAGVKAVPAYAGDDSPYPQADGGLGFVISLNYYDIYYAGSTALTDAIKGIKPDIAILPIDGRGGTLSLEEAVTFVEHARPRWVIPCNYSGDSTTESQLASKLFKKEAEKFAEVVILPLVR